jgi:hypothetical protein
MKLGLPLTVIGIALIVIAWSSAAGIPEAANRDFDRLVQASGGMSHTANFPDVYKQMCANRRILQNFYIGAAGLICLAVGLGNLNRSVKQTAAPDGEDAAGDP